MSEFLRAPGAGGQRPFVGREDLLSAFDKALATVPADEPRVLAFHGIGGIGKSRLIRRLRGEGNDPRRIPDGVVHAKIDFQDPENRLPVRALERARAQLHRQGVQFPTFDIAFAVWWKLANPSTDLKQALPAFLEATELSGEILGTLEDVPILGLVSKIPRALVKLGKIENDWWTKRGQKELAHIAALTDHNEIAAWLPIFFGADLAAWQKEDDERKAVLLFDTHEALFTERGSGTSGEAHDLWLLRWMASLPGALVVVSGRNALDWAEEGDWTGEIDEKQVAELGPDEAESLLAEAGVEDAELRSAIVEKSRGVPQYLELAAATYQKILQKEGRQPRPEDFDSNLGKLLHRFLHYVSDAEEQALYVLSVPETFDFDLYGDLMRRFGAGMATRQSLTRLTRFSFLSQPEPDRHALHALVRDALASEQDVEDRREIHQHLFDRAAAILSDVKPREIGETERRALRDGVLHGLEALERDDLLDWFLNAKEAYDQAAEWNLLVPLYQALLAAGGGAQGEPKRRELTLTNNLAFNLEKLGRLTEAEPLYRRVLEVRERVLGADHPDTLVSVNNLGFLLQAQGSLEAAEPLLRRGLEGCERVLGADHPDTLVSVNNLAGLLQAQGKLEAAEPLLRRGLEGRERVLGADHPETLVSVNNLGSLLQAQGNLEAAEPLFRRGLEVRERALGADHPDTLGSVNNLGALLESQGNLEAAEPLFRRGLEGSERVLGADHPFTLVSVNNLAGLLQAQGNLEAAEPLYRRGLEVRERVLGADHPDTLGSVNNLAALLYDQGRLEAAEPLVQRALEGATRTLGADHPTTQIFRANLQAVRQQLEASDED